MTREDQYSDPEGPGQEDADLLDENSAGYICANCGAEMYDDTAKCPECGSWPEAENEESADTSWVLPFSIIALATLFLIIWGLMR